MVRIQDTFLSSSFLNNLNRRSAKYIVMIPCNSDDEVDDSWIYTSHKQFKHEKTNLCIGKLN